MPEEPTQETINQYLYAMRNNAVTLRPMSHRDLMKEFVLEEEEAKAAFLVWLRGINSDFKQKR